MSYHAAIIGIPSFLFFTVGYILLSITSKITNAVKKSRLGILDRILGGVFGACKGALIVVVLITVTDHLYPDFSQYAKESSIYKFVQSDHSAINYIKNGISNLYQYFNEYLVQLFSK